MQHPYTRDSKKKKKLATPKAELKHYNGQQPIYCKGQSQCHRI
jgi:hypothetical protein